MLTYKTHLARPSAARRAAVVPSRAARVLVRADKNEALKELENFRNSVAVRMQESVDEAENPPAPTTAPVVMAAQVVEVATDATTTEAPAALRELTKDDFYEFLGEAQTLVVVDFFTDWCGPCKMIYPELVKLNAELEGKATICKFNCNAYNKDLGKALAIKVAPTFHLYKGGEKVAEMTGAKVDKLRSLIEANL